jgi:thiol-disulfide isomerase/thioredoxin
MQRLMKPTWVAATLVLLLASSRGFADDRTAETILKEIDQVKMPVLDRSKVRDQAYVQDFIAKSQDANAKRGTLIHELYKVAPDNEKLPTLLRDYWMNTDPRQDRGEKLSKEIDDILAHAKNPAILIEANFLKAQLKLAFEEGLKVDMSPIEAFLKLAPKDERSPTLLYMAAMRTKDQSAKQAIEDRLLKDYPDSRFSDPIKGARRQREGIGKPFELEFTDAIKGTNVSMGGLKGKIVVVDFWATWCGPCVAEMPRMKELYRKYHDKGVEFIGVSLDKSKEEGGLDALKKYVKENDVPWPQYYQGNYWASEFSSKWGINAIPSMFVVDADGKLFSVDAREHLEKMLPELLAKKSGSAPAGG